MGGITQHFVLLQPESRLSLSLVPVGQAAWCIPPLHSVASLGGHPAGGMAPVCVPNRGQRNQGAFSAQHCCAAGLYIPLSHVHGVGCIPVPTAPSALQGQIKPGSPATPRVCTLGQPQEQKSTLQAPGEANHLLPCCFPVLRHSPAQSAEEGI